jgi:hypothetical protein
MLGGIADARITDTQGSMYKDLQLDVRHLAMDGRNLFHREFSGKDNTRETQVTEPSYFLWGAVVCLSAGMESRIRVRVIRPPLTPPARLAACYRRDARTQGEN